MLPAQVTVLRDVDWHSIPAAELVPGDIIQIRAGNKIPADLRIVEASSDLKFNRSVLTGESNAISGSLKCTSDNFLEVHFELFNADILDEKYRDARNALHIWLWYRNHCPHRRPHRLR
jgi:magnesium-transporting ATPase (P-type)